MDPAAGKLPFSGKGVQTADARRSLLTGRFEQGGQSFELEAPPASQVAPLPG